MLIADPNTGAILAMLAPIPHELSV